MNISKTIQPLKAEWITPKNFKLYGQVISASEDGIYDINEAQLNLQNGIPRFYIMRLYNKGCRFHTITRHVKCTQCLGSLEGKDWLIAVAPPNSNSEEPTLENLAAFRIPGNCFIKLEIGTWHAGPYFEQEFIDFYNLELRNTNIDDHFSYNFLKNHSLEFEIV